MVVGNGKVLVHLKDMGSSNLSVNLLLIEFLIVFILVLFPKVLVFFTVATIRLA
jgi:hypothetical protein